MNHFRITLAVAVVGALGLLISQAMAQDVAPKSGEKAAATPTTRPAPKALSNESLKGLQWLAKQQLDSGAWGQGEESSNMGGGEKLKDVPNVADTCMATLALMRSGSTPKEGAFKDNINRAVAFICGQVEESDDKTLYITALRGTRTQQKLGGFIDTFLAAQVLGELRNKMGDDGANKRLVKALDKVVGKIEVNQKDDGKFASDGWAPTLMQGQASKAVNTIVANGGTVQEDVRERLEKNAQAELNGTAPAPSGSAGVELYARSAQLAAIQGSATANDKRRDELDAIVKSAATQPKDRAAAQATLQRYDDNEKALDAAQKQIVAKMSDQKFISGFGSNGGEEFLSYLNIGESLFLKGGEAWNTWDKKTTDNLNNVQNADGSWSGHHCITGRTFCTSAALMVLTIDREPAPTAAKISEKHN
jgi:hypothetical protein